MNIYLHHYPASLFSEKIRLILGYLKLPWHSVEINNIMPRPLLMPLSGGYRKTPCLQIGANVYCDTQVIARGLARHAGDETLGSQGFVGARVAEWADSHLFRVTVALNFRPEAVVTMMGQLGEADMEAFMKDRAELSAGSDIVSYSDAAAMAFINHYLVELNSSLEADFLFGDTPCIADFSVYHCLWFLRSNAVNASLLEPHSRVMDWVERMNAFGHGSVTTATGEDALGAALEVTPTLPRLGPNLDPLPAAVAVGDQVSVAPVDYGRIQVQGELVAWDAQEIVIRRQTVEAGELLNHFPSSGFEVAAG